MPSRRDFIQAGLAASVLPEAILGARVTAAPVRETRVVMPDVHRIYTVVSDVRFAPGAAFGLEAERLGARLVRIQGDITDFWFNDLSVRWKESPVPIAGLTAHGPIFCLERLAWDHGLRVVFRGEHRVLGSGHLAHSISGPPATVVRSRSLALEGRRWTSCIAGLVTACETHAETLSAEMIMAPANGAPDSLPEPLVSWVIAPITRGETSSRPAFRAKDQPMGVRDGDSTRD